MATFGNENTAGGLTRDTENDLLGVHFTAPEDGDITQLSAYVTPSPSSGTYTAKAAIYAYVADNDAGALLASSSEVTGITGAVAQWVDFPISLNITGSTQYFFVVWFNDVPGTCVLRYDDPAVNNSSIYDSVVYSGSFPDPFAEDGVFLNNRYSIYATYTPASTGPNINVLVAASGLIGGLSGGFQK